MTLLETRNLRIEARFGRRRRTIVTGIDLSVEAGETVGIVGESGSGKSMTARAIVGLLPRGLVASGRVTVEGRAVLDLPERAMRRVRGRRIALLLQDPFTMLNPVLPVGRQIVETLPRQSRAARRAEAARRLAEVGIHDVHVAAQYPFQLSGGMRQRVAIAAALASDPEVLVADEPSTALDVTTQKEILVLLRTIQQRRGMGLVLITHDLRVAFAMCDRIYVLYAGSVLEAAGARALEAEPLHPYTLGLLLSEPSVERRFAELRAIDGTVPAPDEVAGRCPFVTRCDWRAAVCSAGSPPLRAVAEDRLSACVRIEEIRADLARARASAELREAHTVAAAAAGDALVRVEGLRKHFVRGAREVVALAGVSIAVRPGESVGLVGESGSGKTTLARCLVGLETPTAGRILIDGIDATDYDRLSTAARRELRRRVQIVFQDPYSSLNPVRTVGTTLKEALSLAPRGGDRRWSVADLLELVGLPAAYARRKPVALSGGERQRVAIARALALRPSLLVCDEPVSALDVSVQAQILNLFRSLRDVLGVGYLFITHDLAVVRQVVDRVYVLHRGVVVEEGAADRVLDSPADAYTARLVESVPRSDAAWLR